MASLQYILYVRNTYIRIMYVCVCTCTSSPQGETVVDLVDEEHSKEFEELKTVAEAAQGVSAGRVGRCPTATHLSFPESLSFCRGYIRTTCV